MTQLTRTAARPTSGLIAAVALAAALGGGIVGSGIQALLAGAPAGAHAATPREVAVLQNAIAWEGRYRQMYPESR